MRNNIVPLILLGLATSCTLGCPLALLPGPWLPGPLLESETAVLVSQEEQLPLADGDVAVTGDAFDSMEAIASAIYLDLWYEAEVEEGSGVEVRVDPGPGSVLMLSNLSDLCGRLQADLDEVSAFNERWRAETGEEPDAENCAYHHAFVAELGGWLDDTYPVGSTLVQLYPRTSDTAFAEGRTLIYAPGAGEDTLTGSIERIEERWEQGADGLDCSSGFEALPSRHPSLSISSALAGGEVELDWDEDVLGVRILDARMLGLRTAAGDYPRVVSGSLRTGWIGAERCTLVQRFLPPAPEDE